jgi:hypothetical protein
MSMSAYEQSSTSSGGSEDLKERAKETVAEVDAGAMHVAGVAGEEAGNVAHEAKSAARGFFRETRVQLADQASTQQHRAAGAMRSTADDLVGMADSGSGGAAAGLVRGLGNQTRQVASWLEEREPADLVEELRGFARRHTGAFLAAAVGVGILAGRLTRAMMPSGDSGSSGTGGTTGGYGASGMGGTTGGYGASGMGGAGMAGTGVSGGAAYDDAGMGSAGSAGAMPGAGAGRGEAPIGDALAAEPMGTQSGTNATGGREGIADPEEPASGEWSPSGEAQR